MNGTQEKQTSEYARNVIALIGTSRKKGVRRSAFPEYKLWKGMKDRCYNPKNVGYRYYGGRGITVCDEWRKDFCVFLKDVGQRPTSKHSLERINNDRGYCAGNVRWATTIEQANNKRNNRMFTYEGETRNMTQWAKLKNMELGTLNTRLNKLKWPIEKALTYVRHQTVEARRKMSETKKRLAYERKMRTLQV